MGGSRDLRINRVTDSDSAIPTWGDFVNITRAADGPPASGVVCTYLYPNSTSDASIENFAFGYIEWCSPTEEVARRMLLAAAHPNQLSILMDSGYASYTNLSLSNYRLIVHYGGSGTVGVLVLGFLNRSPFRGS